jgi:ferric-dicitrate binding protein FerR (iron transport regulator)
MEELIERYRKGEISRSQLEKALEQEWQKLDPNNVELQDYYRPEMIQFILSKKQEDTPVVKMQWWKYVAAASIIAFIAIGASVLFIHQKKIEKSDTVAIKPKDIQPGKQGAILTLADGSNVSLDSVKNGVVAPQGGATAKIDNGKLVYEATGDEVVYNTITTPRGRKFQMTLPDGSQVWLNASSSITYPTVFSGNERKVKINGEVFIDVVKKTDMPFKVNVADRNEIEVLGTSFNVEAYNDDNVINTTLLDGAVKVSIQNNQTTKSIVLKPGQQAKNEHQELALVDGVDVNKVIAWKRGVFNFDGADLLTIMQQLARWYDVDIAYEGTVPVKKFRGEISRDVPVSKVFEILAYTGVHFKIEGKKLIVTQ